MRIQENINKLMIAISLKGKKIKIVTRTYYSDFSEKYITRYVLYEKVKYKDKYKRKKEKWIEYDSCYGKIDLLKILIRYHKEIEGEANE